MSNREKKVTRTKKGGEQEDSLNKSLGQLFLQADDRLSWLANHHPSQLPDASQDALSDRQSLPQSVPEGADLTKDKFLVNDNPEEKINWIKADSDDKSSIKPIMINPKNPIKDPGKLLFLFLSYISFFIDFHLNREFKANPPFCIVTKKRHRECGNRLCGRAGYGSDS